MRKPFLACHLGNGSPEFPLAAVCLKNSRIRVDQTTYNISLYSDVMENQHGVTDFHKG